MKGRSRHGRFVVARRPLHDDGDRRHSKGLNQVKRAITSTADPEGQ